MTNAYNYGTIPRNSTRKQKDLSYSSDDLAFKTIKPVSSLEIKLFSVRIFLKFIIINEKM